ncbi:unnamed protein product, partial [Rotaria sordida]
HQEKNYFSTDQRILQHSYNTFFNCLPMKQFKFNRVSVSVVSRTTGKVKPIHNMQFHPTIHSTPIKNYSDDLETLPSTSISLPKKNYSIS